MHEQIAKLDAQITDLIPDLGELEEAIMDSEVVQDEIIEKINELSGAFVKGAFMYQVKNLMKIMKQHWNHTKRLWVI